MSNLPSRPRLARFSAASIGVALLGAALLAGCVATPAPSAGDDLAVVDSNSPLGNYLAGRFASQQADSAAAARYYEAALQDDPDNQRLLQRAFTYQLAGGDMPRALELAQRLVERRPNAAMALLTLAIDDIANGRHTEARDRLTGAADANFIALLRPLVVAWSQIGDGDAAAANAAVAELGSRQALETFRTYHQALLNDVAGEAETAAGEYDKARKSLAGNATRLVLAHASFLARQGERDKAQSVLSEHRKVSPNNPVISQAARILRDTGTLPAPVRTASQGIAEAFYGAALAVARDRSRHNAKIYARLALHLRPDFDSAKMLLGDVFESDEQWQKAIDIYSQIAETSPYKRDSQIRVATSLNQIERVDEAVAVLRALSEQESDRIDSLVALGNMLRSHERYAEAGAEYDKALARLGDGVTERHWSLFYSRGIARERAKRWPEAEKDFLKALELQPDQPLVLNYLGYSWVDQGLNLDRARKMIESAVEQRPRDGYIVDSLGWVLYRLGDYDEAVRVLERAVSLRPEDPVINDHLGDAYWRVGRRLEAQFQWNHAVALKPEAPELEKIRAKLANGLPDANGTVRSE